MILAPKQTITVSARWIFPVARPPISGGAIVVENGRIAELLSDKPRDLDFDFDDAVILPGLVNAHVHLDLTSASGLAVPSSDFVGWLKEVIAFRRSMDADDVRTAVQEGIRQCLRNGTTLIGDISGDGSSWPIVAASGLRAVVFRELIGLPKDRAERAWQSAQEWLGACPPTDRCRPGLSPHAPYSARVSLIKAAAQSGVPCAMHVAEFAGERELLVEHGGPFVPFLQGVGAWDPLGLAKSPEHVLRLLEGSSPTLAVHANYLADSVHVPGNISVVYCPRTQRAFEHPAFPLQRWIERGVRLALGTDSLASNPDLSLLDELRFIRANDPEIENAAILRLGTLAGAEALGFAGECGSLEPGKAADFVVVPIEPSWANDDPHESFLTGNAAPRETWIGGNRVWP